MKRNALMLLGLVFATGLIAAGCGGNDDESSDTGTDATTALSKQEFLVEANQICAKGNNELDQAGKAIGQSADQAELEKFVTDTLIPNIQGQIDDIRALGIPEADEAEVNAILDDAEADLDALEADPASIQNNDVFKDVNQRLGAYGLTTCAGGE